MDFDYRNSDYLYKGFDVGTVVLDEGDSFARYKARILEIKESMKIVHQALEYIKTTGTLAQKLINPLTLKLPEGGYYADIEAPRGIASCFVLSNGENALTGSNGERALTIL